MKIQIELSEMEGFARNKLLVDIGTAINKDLINNFMDYTDKCIKSQFGNIFITEEYLLINMNPKCVVEFSDILNRTMVPGSTSVVYLINLLKIVRDSFNMFNEKWGVYENEIENNINE